MIDWDKPIETVDGRVARLIETNVTKPGIWHIVYVSDIEDSDGFGAVFIVNQEGFRCADRAIYGKPQEPFIRNARVKREGWVLVRPHGEQMERRCLADDNVYASEAEAELLKKRWYGADPGIKTVHLTWEE